MTIYIALIRGINVGGKNKIAMAELKRAFESIDLKQVKTYIQSGNVLFASEEHAETLRQRIEQEISATFGISTAVILRTAEDLEMIIANCPFSADSLLEGESIHVSILAETPSQKALDMMSDYKDGIDEYRIIGMEIYFWFRQSILDSPLAKNLQKLGGIATTRNWNTIMKLDALAKTMKIPG